MFRYIGLPELLIVLFVGFVVIFSMWKIFTKAGYPGILSLAMFVPIVNAALLLFLALSDWPTLKELRLLRQRPAPSAPPAV